MSHPSPANPPPPRFRPMRLPDLETVLELEAGCHPDPWTADMMRKSLEAGHRCLVLELDGTTRGHAVLQVAAGEAELLNICIHPDCRGRGLGRAFLRHLVALAREAGAAHLFLEVRASNGQAVALYASEGFNRVGRRPRYYPHPEGREDALVMARHLGGDGSPFPGG